MKRVEHRVAFATAVATWVLLLVGCMVHGSGSSLACPDWPTCFGTFFPEMKNGVEYEHSHRLLASAVGLMTLVLAALLHRRRSEGAEARRAANLGLLAAALVIAQGVLGGITVRFKLPIGVTLAHLATSMCFFALLVYLTIRTAPLNTNATGRNDAAPVDPRPVAVLRPFVAISALGTLAQIVLGGVVRHTHNGLACSTIPLCDGGTLWPVHIGERIQMGHRIVGVVLACWITGVAVATLRRSKSPDVQRLSHGAIALVVAQVGLGLWSVADMLPLLVVTAHLGIAALILVDQLVLFVRLPGGGTNGIALDERARASGSLPGIVENRDDAVHA